MKSNLVDWLLAEGFTPVDEKNWQRRLVSGAGPVTFSVGFAKVGYLVYLFGGGKGTVYLGHTTDEKAVKEMWNAVYTFVRSQS